MCRGGPVQGRLGLWSEPRRGGQVAHLPGHSFPGPRVLEEAKTSSLDGIDEPSGWKAPQAGDLLLMPGHRLKQTLGGDSSQSRGFLPL